jgi:hypothetical protein
MQTVSRRQFPEGSATGIVAANRRDMAAAFPNIQAPVYGFSAGTDTNAGATIPETTKLMKAAGIEGAGTGSSRPERRPMRRKQTRRRGTPHE